MRLVFMGTSEFAVPALQELVSAGHEILHIVTQPDRPFGRKAQLKPSPVKEAAEALGLTILQPEKIRDEGYYELLTDAKPDAAVVAAYGQILPKRMLELPRLGCINLHGSLLPALRGPAPIHWALLLGLETTGVTTMLMDSGVDTGAMLLQESLTIDPNEDRGSLERRLADLGAGLVTRTLAQLDTGALIPAPQVNSRSTYAPFLTPEQTAVFLTKSAAQIHNTVRALSPSPGARLQVGQETLKVWKTSLPNGEEQAAAWERSPNGLVPRPGQVLSIRSAALIVQAGDAPISLLEVQPLGGSRMTGEQWARGRRLVVGDNLLAT